MNNIENDYLLLFAHCVPVRGIKYSVIQDNLRQAVTRVPNQVFDFLTRFNRKKITTIKKSNFEGTEEIIDFLVEKEFVFFADNPKRFPEIAEMYETPERINNAIIEYSDIFAKYSHKIISELTQLRCKHLELRFYESVEFKIIQELLPTYTNGSLLSVDVYLAYSEENLLLEKITNLMLHNPIISFFVLHSVPDEILTKLQSEGFRFAKLLVTSESIHSNLHCGVIAEKYFSMNFQSYLLSKNYNNCLYKKISIDKEGQIKLCPSQKQSYGSIENTSLIDVVDKLALNPLTTMTKDAIKTCQNCEYRYACSDCRAFLENPDDMYSKPLKCGYDPSTGIWEKWSTHPMKQDAIVHYGLQSVTH